MPWPALGTVIKFVFHLVPGQFAGHVGGQLIGDVGVLGAVNHQRRRVFGGDVADGTDRGRVLARSVTGSKPVTSLVHRPFWRR